MVTRRSLLLSILSGIALWSGFAPLEIWCAPLLGAIFLFLAMVGKDLPERLTLSFISGLAFFLPLLHWSSVYVGSIPWLLLALGESLLFGLVGIFRIYRRWESALMFSALFTLVELIRMKFPFGGFGWGRLGFTQVEPFHSLYPIVGVTGISFLVFSSTLFVLSFRSFFVSAFFFASLFFLVNIVADNEIPKRTLQVTAIQGGVTNLGLDFNARALDVLKRHVQATRPVSGTSLYLWPENAADVDPLKNLEANGLVTTLAQELNTPLLVGAVEDASGGPANSSLLFNSKGELVSRYQKQDLAPFGEYMPVRKLAESISPFAKNVTDFRPGKSWTKHLIDGIPFQSLICFEVLDDDHAKVGAKGSSFVVAQTNNATFGRSSEAAQQLQITRARAAESGREFAVVSTTGYTAHIDSSGKILARAPQFQTSELTMKVQLVAPETQTPAQRLNSGIWAAFLLLILGLLRRRLSR